MKHTQHSSNTLPKIRTVQSVLYGVKLQVVWKGQERILLIVKLGCFSYARLGSKRANFQKIISPVNEIASFRMFWSPIYYIRELDIFWKKIMPFMQQAKFYRKNYTLRAKDIRKNVPVLQVWGPPLALPLPHWLQLQLSSFTPYRADSPILRLGKCTYCRSELQSEFSCIQKPLFNIKFFRKVTFLQKI